MSELVLEVDGVLYAGWEAARVTRSVDAAAGSFELAVSDRQTWPIALGSRCRVLIDDDPVVTGHVERVRVQLDGRTHQLQVSGRDLTGDLVDSSTLVAPGEWLQSGLARIAREIAAPLSIAVDVTGDEGEPFLLFASQPGETCFEAIERAARLRGLLATTRGDGVLELARPGALAAAVALVEGENLLAGALELDDTARYRRYVVRGQHPGGELLGDDIVCAAEGEAHDLAMRESRAMLVIAEGAVTPARAAERAQWEAAVRAARGALLTVRVQGWRQSADGALWAPNLRVPVQAPTFGIAGELLIAAVTWSLADEEGEICELELVRPDAYQPAPDLDADEDALRRDLLARHGLDEEDGT